MKIIKKLFLVLVLVIVSSYSYQLNAQKSTTEKGKFDHWAIDLAAGIHQVDGPLSGGYSSSVLFQANFGARYMFNKKFGLRLGFGYNSFSESAISLPFKSNLYRASLEGVVNLGNVLDFQNWTKRFNLLAHVGGGFSSLNSMEPIENDADLITHLSVGFTPQFKLSNRVSVFIDLASFINYNQRDNFDGVSNREMRQTNVSYINTSLGLSIALGKNKQLADSAQKEEEVVYDELAEIKKRLSATEKEIATLEELNVSNNKTNLIYELDARYANKEEINKLANTVSNANVDYIKELLNRDYINVFFDINKSIVQKESLSALHYVRQFMNDNPYVHVSLIGYADETGEEGYNQILSKKRAKTVYDILVDSGISATRLTYIGVGEDKTMIKSAKQLARKVAFRIK